MSERGALAGLRVVELGSGIAAPYAGWLLAALGADVVKVEPPGIGDPLRRQGPLAASGSSGLFEYLNANKRSVALDVRDGPELDRLLTRADLLVEDLGPGGLAVAGYPDPRLDELNPALVRVRLSDFGQDGPFRDVPATGFTLQAMAGWVAPRTRPDSVPVQVGGDLQEYVAGVFSAVAALTALRAAGRTGRGVVADVSKLEAAHSALPPPTLYAHTLRKLGWGSVSAQHRPLDVVACKDGWVGINMLTAQQWEDMCLLFGMPEFIDEWAALKQGGPRLGEFAAKAAEWLERHTADEVIELCQAFRVPSIPVSNGATMPRLPQWQERPFFHTGASRGGDVLTPGFPWRLSGTPVGVRRPAPLLGEHTGEVAAEPPVRARWIAGAGPPPGEPPLAGLKVVDLASFWAGSYLTCYLGAMGADVVKVESVQRPDGFRYGKTFRELGEDWYERSDVWQGTNLNKRDVTLDLNSERGRELLRRLLADADMLVENYSARVVEAFGFGFDAVHELNPRLVMVRLPGFGLEGPWRDNVGFGHAFEQGGGLAWMTGHPELPPATPGGYADPVVGMHGAVAALAALAHRDRTGEGQLVEVPQIEVVACTGGGQVIEHSLTGAVPMRRGNADPRALDQGVYRTTDGWVAVTLRGEAERDALGGDDLAAWCARRTSAEAAGALRAAGVPVAALPAPESYLTHPQLVERRYFTPLTHPVTGRVEFPGWPMRYSTGPQEHHRSPAPTLGQDNAAILTGRLGLDADELAELERQQVIGTRPKGLGASAKETGR
ncbi:CoA transferase [Dactylosporangium sp. NPDC000555]|uniref:CaiB/BaiF CoA transferase family protein n=1 Tax=Dactylosporangium sp. NPDC000555 TaxID=3154260 RepID=UPI003331966C